MIVANRGSDIEFTFNWTTTAGENANLTGWAIGVMDVSAVIANFLTATITTAASGLITVRITWDDAFEVETEYYFRIQITSGADSESTNLIGVTYQ